MRRDWVSMLISEVGKVNISQSTYKMLKNDSDFVFESHGLIDAKSKGEVEMHFVTVKTLNESL